MREERFGDVTAVLDDRFVATVEIHRPPENFFEVDVIRSLADACAALDDEPDCRAILLCSEGKHFCAGANIGGGSTRASDGPDAPDDGPDAMNREAVRLFAAGTPVVAAIQGAAIGAGFGLACMADFRIGCPQARFAANFARFGYHHILGLSVTLPAIVGRQHALDLLCTGRRVKGDEALAMGLCDRLVGAESLRSAAHALAAEIAACAPVAVASIRATLRADLNDRFRAAVEHEAGEQERLESTADLREGLRAAGEGRPARFAGR